MRFLRLVDTIELKLLRDSKLTTSIVTYLKYSTQGTPEKSKQILQNPVATQIYKLETLLQPSRMLLLYQLMRIAVFAEIRVYVTSIFIGHSLII